MEILSELETSHEEMKKAGKARFCPTRRRSVSCSRLAPSPLPDILVFHQLLKERDLPAKNSKNHCATPMTDFINTTSGSSSGYSPMRNGRASVTGGSLANVPLDSTRFRSRKGKSWFRPKTWMRSKKQRPVINANLAPGLSSQLRVMSLTSFSTEQEMKPTEAFQ